MPYRAFVSSTFLDLKQHRAHVIHALRTAGFIVDPMEDWTADSDEPKKFSQNRVEGCDLCVLLVAFRRGYVPEGEKLSITQLEYETARKQGIDVLTFILKEGEPWSPEFNELDKDAEIRLWRKDLEKYHGVQGFSCEPSSIEMTGALGRWLTKKITHRKREPGTFFQDRLKDDSPAPELVVIPTGTFRMGDIRGSGSANERPVHTVYVRGDTAIGRYETTFDEYDRFARSTGRALPDDNRWGRGRRPVINVCWYDAVEYCQWLSQQTGKRYRLPTEAEWEYAARAGTESCYWWGEDGTSRMANCYGGDSSWAGKQTAPVGSFEPNSFGLYDVAGNVWEWVQDYWHENYKGAPENGSAWQHENDGDFRQRVIRGGSWNAKPEFVRSSFRLQFNPGNRGYGIGFRIAHDIE